MTSFRRKLYYSLLPVLCMLAILFCNMAQSCTLFSLLRIMCFYTNANSCAFQYIVLIYHIFISNSLLQYIVLIWLTIAKGNRITLSSPILKIVRYKGPCIITAILTMYNNIAVRCEYHESRHGFILLS